MIEIDIVPYIDEILSDLKKSVQLEGNESIER